jgi:hypothetical protein
LNAVRSFTVSGSGILTYFPGFTRFSGREAIFVVSGSAPTAALTVKVQVSLQPSDTIRGDFEDRLGASTSTDTGLNKDIGIPEVNLELRSEPIVAKTRKLKAVWTPNSLKT